MSEELSYEAMKALELEERIAHIAVFKSQHEMDKDYLANVDEARGNNNERLDLYRSDVADAKRHRKVSEELWGRIAEALEKIADARAR